MGLALTGVVINSDHIMVKCSQGWCESCACPSGEGPEEVHLHLSVTLCTPTELIELLKLFKMEDLNLLYHADVMEWPLFCCTLTSLQETLPAILSFSLVGLYPLWST